MLGHFRSSFLPFGIEFTREKRFVFFLFHVFKSSLDQKSKQNPNRTRNNLKLKLKTAYRFTIIWWMWINPLRALKTNHRKMQTHFHIHSVWFCSSLRLKIQKQNDKRYNNFFFFAQFCVFASRSKLQRGPGKEWHRVKFNTIRSKPLGSACVSVCVYIAQTDCPKMKPNLWIRAKVNETKKKTPKDWIKIIEVDGRQTDIPTATFIHTLAHTQTHKKKSKREKERTARDKRATEENTRCVCCEKQ